MTTITSEVSQANERIVRFGKNIVGFASDPNMSHRTSDLIYGDVGTMSRLYVDSPHGGGRMRSGMTGYTGLRSNYLIVDSGRLMCRRGVIDNFSLRALPEKRGFEIVVAYEASSGDSKSVVNLSLGGTSDQVTAQQWVDMANKWAKKK